MLLIPSKREARGEALSSRRFREAQSAPRSPIDAQRRLSQRSSMMSQSIEEGVGGSIVSLARLAQQRACRREQYKEVEGSVFEQAMQQPAAYHLWAAKPNSAPPHRVAPAVRPAALRPRALRLGSAANPRLETHLERRLTVLHPPHPPRPDARTLPGLPAHESRQFDGPAGFPLLLSSNRARGGSFVRPIRINRRAPCSTIQRATERPRSPSPPVIR